jgi:hypothetical protein
MTISEAKAIQSQYEPYSKDRYDVQQLINDIEQLEQEGGYYD